MNGCIILFGESFRLGGQGTRDTGDDKSYDGQINAANSHISFIKELSNKNLSIDVHISSYKTRFSDDLIEIYNNNLISYDFYEELIGQGNLISNSIEKITIENYDFILIMRIDLFLKNEFLELFDENWDKIMWPSVCFKPFHTCGRHPRVNDMMMFIPKKYYTYLQYINYSPTGHNQWHDFIENTDLTYDCLDTMLNTYHDSDSAKDFNPLYFIVNRPESTIHHDKGDIFDKGNFFNF
jgi:hypothetical protein